jgi:hypothetical protein
MNQMIIKSELNIKFDFTELGTPQQNGKVEGAFQPYLGKQDPC